MDVEAKDQTSVPGGKAGGKAYGARCQMPLLNPCRWPWQRDTCILSYLSRFKELSEETLRLEMSIVGIMFGDPNPC